MVSISSITQLYYFSASAKGEILFNTSAFGFFLFFIQTSISEHTEEREEQHTNERTSNQEIQRGGETEGGKREKGRRGEEGGRRDAELWCERWWREKRRNLSREDSWSLWAEPDEQSGCKCLISWTRPDCVWNHSSVSPYCSIFTVGRTECVQVLT